MNNKEIENRILEHLKEVNPYFKLYKKPESDDNHLEYLREDPRAFGIVVDPKTGVWPLVHEAGHAKARIKDLKRTERFHKTKNDHTYMRYLTDNEVFANQEAVSLLREFGVPENKIDEYIADLGESYKTYQYHLLQAGYMGKIPTFLSYMRMTMKLVFTKSTASESLISEYDRLRPKYETKIKKVDRPYLIPLKDAL